MIACLSQASKPKQLVVVRVFGYAHERNKTFSLGLSQGNAHAIQQFRTEYVAVSMDNNIEIFNVMA